MWYSRWSLLTSITEGEVTLTSTSSWPSQLRFPRRIARADLLVREAHHATKLSVFSRQFSFQFVDPPLAARILTLFCPPCRCDSTFTTNSPMRNTILSQSDRPPTVSTLLSSHSTKHSFTIQKGIVPFIDPIPRSTRTHSCLFAVECFPFPGVVRYAWPLWR